MSDILPQPTTSARLGRGRVWFVGGVALAVGVVGGIVYWSGRASAERADALQAARDGDFSRAEPQLVKALDRNPADAEVAEVLARGHLKADDDRAEEFLTRWVAAAPNQPEPLRVRMEFYQKRKQSERAYADARRLLDMAPADPDLRRKAIDRGFEAGQFEASEELCRAALREQPRDLGLRMMLARLRQARGDEGGAAAILDELLKEHPNNPRLMFARAILYDEVGNPGAAIPLYQQVLRTDPTRQRTAGYQLALALEKVGRTDEARKVMVEVRRRQDVEVFRDAIRSQPDNLDLQVRLAESLLADGHTQDGLGLLQAVLGRDPGFRPAHRALAEHFQKQGDTRRAAEYRRLAGDP